MAQEGISRRSLAAGAAWAVPVLTVAAPAVAAQASPVCKGLHGSASKLSGSSGWTYTAADWKGSNFSIVDGGWDSAGFNKDSHLTAPSNSVATISLSGTMFQLMGASPDNFSRNLIFHVWERSGVATNSSGVPDDSNTGTSFKQPSQSPKDTSNPARFRFTLNGQTALAFTSRPSADSRYGSTFAGYTAETALPGLYNDSQWNNYFITKVQPTDVLTIGISVTAVGQSGPGGGTRQNDDIYFGFWFACAAPAQKATNSATPELVYPGAYYSGN